MDKSFEMITDSKIDSLEQRVTRLEQTNRESLEKLNDIHDLLFSEGVEHRAVVDDMYILRKMINRFGSLKMFLGILVAFSSFLVSAIYGAMHLIEFVRSLLMTKGG